MAHVCRIDVSDFQVEIVPVKNNESEWNAYSVNAQRDGMLSTRHQTRWYTLPLAALCEKSRPLASQCQATDVDTLLTKLEWASCNLASFLVEFRTQSSSPSAPIKVINYDSPSAPVLPVHPKTNHPIAVSVIARHPSESQRVGVGKHEGVNGRYGHFVCKVSVDPAEVYNSPIGRLEYRFQLYNQDVTLSHSNSLLPGTPRFVGFTVTARRGLPPLRLVRNFHDYCVVLDQFVLDVTASTRKGLLYGFGFFSDISGGVKRSELTHYTKTFVSIPLGDDGVTRRFAFSSPLAEVSVLDATDGERDGANVSHAVIVSSESSAFSTAAVGGRYLAVSRFKTDETTGLCKTSLKATLALVLLCRDPTRPLDEAMMEVADERQRIDLAQEVLNQEVFPDAGVTRTVSFAYGEVISFRLTRRCFESPNHYGTPLLAAAAPRVGAASSPLNAAPTSATATEGTKDAEGLNAVAVARPAGDQ